MQPTAETLQMAPAAMWPSLTEKLAKHKFVHGVLKGRQDLPLFCNPLVIFVLNWMLMLVSLSFQVTYVTYPTMGMPILLFAHFTGFVSVWISRVANAAASLAHALGIVDLTRWM